MTDPTKLGNAQSKGRPVLRKGKGRTNASRCRLRTNVDEAQGTVALQGQLGGQVTWDPESRRALTLGTVRGERAASCVWERYAVRGARHATACTSCSMAMCPCVAENGAICSVNAVCQSVSLCVCVCVCAFPRPVRDTRLPVPRPSTIENALRSNHPQPSACCCGHWIELAPGRWIGRSAAIGGSEGRCGPRQEHSSSLMSSRRRSSRML